MEDGKRKKTSVCRGGRWGYLQGVINKRSRQRVTMKYDRRGRLTESLHSFHDTPSRGGKKTRGDIGENEGGCFHDVINFASKSL